MTRLFRIRSGAVAMGLSAINQYINYGKGVNSVEDYVRITSART